MMTRVVYCQATLCRHKPTSCCFALRDHNDAFTPVRSAYIGLKNLGIDCLNDVSRMLIGRMELSGQNQPHQIPIAGTSI